MKKIKKLLVSVFTALVLFVASFSCLFNGVTENVNAKAAASGISLYFSDLHKPLLSNYTARRFTKSDLSTLISGGSATALLQSENYLYGDNDPYDNTPPNIPRNTWIVIEALFSITSENTQAMINLIRDFNNQYECAVWVITLDEVQSSLTTQLTHHQNLQYRCDYINLYTTYKFKMQNFGNSVADSICNNYTDNQHTDTSPFIVDGKFIERLPNYCEDDSEYASGMTLAYAQSNSHFINFLLNRCIENDLPFEGTVQNSGPHFTFPFSLYVYHQFLDGNSYSEPYMQLPDIGDNPMTFSEIESTTQTNSQPIYFASFTPIPSCLYDTMKDYQDAHQNETDYQKPYILVIGAIKSSPDGLAIDAYYPTDEEIDEETRTFLDTIAASL